MRNKLLLLFVVLVLQGCSIHREEVNPYHIYKIDEIHDFDKSSLVFIDSSQKLNEIKKGISSSDVFNILGKAHDYANHGQDRYYFHPTEGVFDRYIYADNEDEFFTHVTAGRRNECGLIWRFYTKNEDQTINKYIVTVFLGTKTEDDYSYVAPMDGPFERQYYAKGNPLIPGRDEGWFVIDFDIRCRKNILVDSKRGYSTVSDIDIKDELETKSLEELERELYK